MTIAKMSLQECNIFGSTADSPGGGAGATAPCHICLESSFHVQQLPGK